MKSFEYTRAGSLAEALAQLGPPGVVLLAGGVDLLDRMKEGLVEPERLVSLRGLAELDYVRSDGEGLHLGALTTLATLESHAKVRAAWPALADAASHAATPNVRNMATLGGNLAQRPRCWYFRSSQFLCKKKGGETCFALHGENQYHAVMQNQVCAVVHASTPATALVAYGARVKLKGAKAERTLALEQFFSHADVTRENVLAPGEAIVEVVVPPPVEGARAAYHKQTEKESFDWPIADVAVVLEPSAGGTCKRASIVLGAAAPIPWRARAAEAALAGRVVDERSAQAAADAAVKEFTPLAKNGYKVEIFRTVVRRTLLAAVGGAP
jgi:xanthine dehydrogenase YagS FAD-binding subunit